MMKQKQRYSFFPIRVMVFAALGAFLLLMACEVPTIYKLDAFNIEGKYRLVENKAEVGETQLTADDQILIENETAYYDVQMELQRKNYSSEERDLFSGVTVQEEQDYLLWRILLAPGYREIDSGDPVESRENLSKDGGQTDEILLRSRYFKLKSSAFKREYANGPKFRVHACVGYREEGGSSTSISQQECIGYLSEGSISRQAFRYWFEGTTKKGSNRLEGTFGMEVRTLISHGFFHLTSTTIIWSSRIVLERTQSLPADRSLPSGK